MISKIEVNKGTTIKKLKPGARGRSYLIKRPTCHTTVILRDMNHFEGYDKILESLSPRQLLVCFEAIPKGRRIEMLYGSFLEKHKIKSFFYRTQLIV